jgi:hypothetical protein
MITVGLSWHELERITKILDEHTLHYNVDAQDDGGDNQKTGPKKTAARGSSAFYQIDIPDSEYDKLPSGARLKLEGLGIYPEMETPQFEEAPEVQAQKTTPLPPTTYQLLMKYFFPIACILLALSYLKRMF